jgi:hypothetical protein
MTDERIKSISVRETGGYAGVDQEIADVDMAALDPTTQQRVEQELSSSGFFDRSEPVGKPRGFDMPHYEITVTTEGGKQHTVTFVDIDSPDTSGVRQLVETLRNK